MIWKKNNSLPFLDVLVTKTNDGVTTSVYRKPTFTGLGTNFLSFTPRLFKINAIKTLVYRCYNISSNWSIFDAEIKFLKNFFVNNSYPLNLVENCISQFLNKTLDTDGSEELSDVTSDKRYIKLPYYGYLSFAIRKRLSQLLKEHFPDTSFRFIFTNPYTIKSFFPYKDAIPAGLIPNVVYQYTCSLCKQRYVGETKRNLTLRIAEHKGKSARTGALLSNPSFSPIRSHSLDKDHIITDDSFKILMKAIHPFDTKLLESLFIKHTKPELNHQTSSNQLLIL